MEYNFRPLPEDKEIEICGTAVKVKQYLPIREKNKIIEIAMQEADRQTVLNTLILEALFNTYIVLKYTDMEFEDSEYEDILSLYDKLEINGVIDKVIKEIPEGEYSCLYENLTDIVEKYAVYRNSVKAILDTLSSFAPNAAEEMKKTFDEISEKKQTEEVKEIIDLAKALGMRENQ